MENTKQPWILAGYELFAKEGLHGLQVEAIARKVGKSKSSFYHHFVDIDIFVDVLLQHHTERAQILAYKMTQCKALIPDVLEAFLEARQDLFFNKQLRVQREILIFRQCFDKASGLVNEAFLDIWSKSIGLPYDLAHLVLKLVSENFYLQITEESFTYTWFVNYLQEIQTMIQNIGKVAKV
jgi:AcrR family transcriptional regulator